MIEQSVDTPEQIDARKRAAALRALDYVESGMVLGLGTGTTADFFLDALGRRVAEGLRVSGVPTSERSAARARAGSVPLVSLDDCPELDLAIDGADEIDLDTFALIKGAGGALLREKIVAASARRMVVIADERKVSGTFGATYAVPVAVVPFAAGRTAARLAELGCHTTLRKDAQGAPFVSDDGLCIVDCRFPSIPDPHALADHIKSIVGVVDHGLFIDLATTVILGTNDGTKVFHRHAPPDLSLRTT
ncbi:MAG: ribose-5-phosphate isomerase RpiA [Chloroflexota bacterium]